MLCPVKTVRGPEGAEKRPFTYPGPSQVNLLIIQAVRRLPGFTDSKALFATLPEGLSLNST
jgi:hypothetical protein